MGLAINKGQLTPLLNTKNKKTIDTGISGLTSSLHANGLIHSINSLHPEQGYITLSSARQFPNDKWYESDYVRQYRRELAETKMGFGTIPDIPIENVKQYFAEGGFPCFLYEWQEATFQSIFYPVEHEGSTYLIHELKITNNQDEVITIPVKIGGTFSLNRCSYGQLT